LGERIVDQVAEEHARVRALKELRSEIRERIDSWEESGLATDWLSRKLDVDDMGELQDALHEFEDAVRRLGELKSQVGTCQPSGGRELVERFRSGLKDPMMLKEYERTFEELKEQIALDLERDRAMAELEAKKAEKEREALSVRRLQLEEAKREREDASKMAANEEMEGLKKVRDEKRSRRMQWASELETYLSGLRHRLADRPLAITTDGMHIKDPHWTVQDLAQGRGLKAVAGSRMGRKEMVIEVDAIEAERLTFPSEMERIMSLPPEAKLSMTRTPMVRLYVLDTCPEELRSFARSFVDVSYLPMVLELSTGRLFFNEGRRLGGLFADYIQGKRDLSREGVLRSYADQKGVIVVEDVSRELGVPKEVVAEMANDLVRNDRAISITHDSEYALLEKDEEDDVAIKEKED
jgi:hypothetical protein